LQQKYRHQKQQHPEKRRQQRPLEKSDARESFFADSHRHEHGDDFCPEIFGIIVVVVT